MPVLQEFCEQVIHAYNTRNGKKFCELFAFEDQSPIVIALRREMATFFCPYLTLLLLLFFSSSIPVFSSADSNYLLPFIKNLSTTLVVFAFHVDKMENLTIKKMKANGAARLLSKVFNIMLADRSPLQESKRLGIIHITNLAFKIYTKLDITNLCSTFINNLKTGGVELIDFPISQQVTHRYYLGRFSFYKQQLIVAENHFQFAFQHCPIHSWHNKRLILKFLIPTRIIMGKLPSMELLEKYNLKNPYAYLKQTIKRGDIRQFNIIMDQNYHFFTCTWSYLLLKARCPILLWRSCLRRIQSEEDRIMSFKICFDGLLAAGEQNDLDFYDTENILVSLISQGYLRGYLHHQLQQVVLSKVNPFPPINQIKPYFERYNDEIVEEHLKTNQPMVPNDVQNLIDEPEDPLVTVTTTEEAQQQQEEMNGMGDDFDLAFDQAFNNQPTFGMTNMNEIGITSTVVGGGQQQQQQQQQGFFSFQ
ncbi:hypothetical protein INT45_006495 [Circinella minor]|uniref:PCI domain-containing protein n=1 Tax=Circinella minor TaxID=1195481 RepID=A0A8H7S390_9FUNG|nr:hypothetical protein INT45_006495 [Circinella minor]